MTGSGVRQEAPGCLGLAWTLWGHLAVVSWFGLFVVSWAGLLVVWSGWHVLGLALDAVAVGGVLLASFLPGFVALVQGMIRGSLPEIPVAAALFLLTVSALAGLGGTAALLLALGESLQRIMGGTITGVLAFPLTVGLVFPLALPLACSVFTWARISAHGHLSSTAWGVAAAVATAGWSLVMLAGIGLGVA